MFLIVWHVVMTHAQQTHAQQTQSQAPWYDANNWHKTADAVWTKAQDWHNSGGWHKTADAVWRSEVSFGARQLVFGLASSVCASSVRQYAPSGSRSLIRCGVRWTGLL